uniref:SANT domain-containing protein n=1 Tax=Spongospora subterranea TaxID=70186 RepID=A0A0H5R9C9_9EUKA|eukprot:CRZ10381.1 hypothetical protein [Spongospora subterranea]
MSSSQHWARGGPRQRSNRPHPNRRRRRGGNRDQDRPNGHIRATNFEDGEITDRRRPYDNEFRDRTPPMFDRDNRQSSGPSWRRRCFGGSPPRHPLPRANNNSIPPRMTGYNSNRTMPRPIMHKADLELPQGPFSAIRQQVTRESSSQQELIDKTPPVQFFPEMIPKQESNFPVLGPVPILEFMTIADVPTVPKLESQPENKSFLDHSLRVLNDKWDSISQVSSSNLQSTRVASASEIDFPVFQNLISPASSPHGNSPIRIPSKFIRPASNSIPSEVVPTVFGSSSSRATLNILQPTTNSISPLKTCSPVPANVSGSSLLKVFTAATSTISSSVKVSSNIQLLSNSNNGAGSSFSSNIAPHSVSENSIVHVPNQLNLAMPIISAGARNSSLASYSSPDRAPNYIDQDPTASSASSREHHKSLMRIPIGNGLAAVSHPISSSTNDDKASSAIHDNSVADGRLQKRIKLGEGLAFVHSLPISVTSSSVLIEDTVMVDPMVVDHSDSNANVISSQPNLPAAQPPTASPCLEDASREDAMFPAMPEKPQSVPPRRIGFGEGLASFIRLRSDSQQTEQSMVSDPVQQVHPDSTAPDQNHSSVSAASNPEINFGSNNAESGLTSQTSEPFPLEDLSVLPDISSYPSQSELLAQIQKLDDEIAETESNIARQKNLIEEKTLSDSHCVDQSQEESISSVVGVCDGKTDFNQIYNENQRLARASYQLLSRFNPKWLSQKLSPGTMPAFPLMYYEPLYIQPSDFLGLNSISSGFQKAKKLFLRAFQQRLCVEASRTRLLALSWWSKYRQWRSGLSRSDALVLPPLRHSLSPQKREYYARRLAPIPNMQDEQRRTTFRFFSRNAIVEDPRAQDQLRKLINPWSEHEKTIFKKKYSKFPKNFVKIASFLSNKTIGDCVSYYYSSKTIINYKNLVRKYRKSLLSRKGIDVGSASIDPEDTSIIDAADAPALPSDKKSEKPASLPRELLKLAEDLSRNNLEVQASRSRGKRRRADEVEASDATEAKSYDAARSKSIAASDKSVSRNTSLRDGNDSASTSVDVDKTGAIAPINPSSKKRRASASSSWDLREKKVFLEALLKYGKDFEAIGDTVQSKSAEKCKNYFNNNKNRLNLDRVLEKREKNATKSNDGDVESDSSGHGSVERYPRQKSARKPKLQNVAAKWSLEEKQVFIQCFRTHGLDLERALALSPHRSSEEIISFYHHYNETTDTLAISQELIIADEPPKQALVDESDAGTVAVGVKKAEISGGVEDSRLSDITGDVDQTSSYQGQGGSGVPMSQSLNSQEVDSVMDICKEGNERPDDTAGEDVEDVNIDPSVSQQICAANAILTLMSAHQQSPTRRNAVRESVASTILHTDAEPPSDSLPTTTPPR